MPDPDSSNASESDTLFTCWTTLSSEDEALAIANAFVNEGIAACVQLDGPIQSVYRWGGERCCSTEYRLWLKVVGTQLPVARKRLAELHPYDTPQWIENEAARVDEKYLIWAKEASNLRGFQNREPK